MLTVVRTVSRACRLVAGWLALGMSMAVLADTPADRDAAVSLARAGDFAAALDRLVSLRLADPANPGLLQDELIVRAWAEDDAGVLRLSAELDFATTSATVLALIAKSARNLGDFPLALHWYDAALAADPAAVDVRAGLAMTLADAGRHGDARNALRGVLPARQQEAAVLLASAYLFSREGLHLPALNEYERVLRAEPDNAEALRGRIMTLRALLLPGEALAESQRYPGLITDAEAELLEVEALGLQLRRAIQLPDQDYPNTEINRVLGAIDARLALVQPGSAASLRLRYDRVVGRTACLRTLEAIADYEALLAEGQPIPAYVHYAAGQAYAHRRRPEEALVALEAAAVQDPDDLEIRFETFYALVDLERHREAMALIDDLAASLNPVNQEPDSRVAVANPAWTRANITAAMARAYADDLVTAGDSLESLLQAAPNNQDARYSLANVYRYRGWRYRPAPDYRQVVDAAPRQLPARAALAHNYMDAQLFPQAEEELRGMQVRQPAHTSVQDLNLRWLLHDRWHLFAGFEWGESSGQTFGTDQHDLGIWLFTPPLADNYRFYVRSSDSYAAFNDGADARRRIAAGADYRAGPWNLRAEVNGNRTEGGQVGGALRVDRYLDDSWSVSGELEYDSYATPIRAERAGIRSDLAVVGVRYRRDDRYSSGAGLAVQRYTDDNDRVGVYADSRLRLLNGIGWNLDGLLAVGASRNSRGDETPYFAPESDAEINAGVEAQWRQFRRFERSLVHRVWTTGGTYRQENFGSNGIWSLGYDLSWSVTESVALGAGALRQRRVYDGAPEYQTFFNLRLDMRF